MGQRQNSRIGRNRTVSLMVRPGLVLKSVSEICPPLPLDKNFETTTLFIIIHILVGYAMRAIIVAYDVGGIKHRLFGRAEIEIHSEMRQPFQDDLKDSEND